MPGKPFTPGPTPQRRGATVIAAGLLLAALALVVLYTSRGALLSPLALVVFAAIGTAALLLQLRMRPDIAPAVRASVARNPLRINALGLIFAAVALIADVRHLDPTCMLIAALAAVMAFAASGILVLGALRKQ